MWEGWGPRVLFALSKKGQPFRNGKLEAWPRLLPMWFLDLTPFLSVDRKYLTKGSEEHL